MDELNTTEARQRVERWADEGQHLLGRVLPGLLEQHDRLRSRAEEAEQVNERLRQELTELQRELHTLRVENQMFKKDQTEVRDVFAKLVEHTSQMLKPMNEILQKLQPEH
jgi:predicted nuclease with TOPRIM domain